MQLCSVYFIHAYCGKAAFEYLDRNCFAGLCIGRNSSPKPRGPPVRREKADGVSVHGERLGSSLSHSSLSMSWTEELIYENLMYSCQIPIGGDAQISQQVIPPAGSSKETPAGGLDCGTQSSPRIQQSYFRDVKKLTQHTFSSQLRFISFNISHYKYLKIMHTVINSWLQTIK